VVMTRSLEELEQAAEAARAALDALDTSTDPTQDASDLRRISEILAVRVVQERELAEAVTEARTGEAEPRSAWPWEFHAKPPRNALEIGPPDTVWATKPAILSGRSWGLSLREGAPSEGEANPGFVCRSFERSESGLGVPPV